VPLPPATAGPVGRRRLRLCGLCGTVRLRGTRCERGSQSRRVLARRGECRLARHRNGWRIGRGVGRLAARLLNEADQRPRDLELPVFTRQPFQFQTEQVRRRPADPGTGLAAAGRHQAADATADDRQRRHR